MGLWGSWFGSKAGASSSSSAAAPAGGHESTSAPSSSSVAAAGGGRPSGSADHRTSPLTLREVMNEKRKRDGTTNHPPPVSLVSSHSYPYIRRTPIPSGATTTSSTTAVPAAVPANSTQKENPTQQQQRPPASSSSLSSPDNKKKLRRRSPWHAVLTTQRERSPSPDFHDALSRPLRSDRKNRPINATLLDGVTTTAYWDAAYDPTPGSKNWSNKGTIASLSSSSNNTATTRPTPNNTNCTTTASSASRPPPTKGILKNSKAPIPARVSREPSPPSSSVDNSPTSSVPSTSLSPPVPVPVPVPSSLSKEEPVEEEYKIVVETVEEIELEKVVNADAIELFPSKENGPSPIPTTTRVSPKPSPLTGTNQSNTKDDGGTTTSAAATAAATAAGTTTTTGKPKKLKESDNPTTDEPIDDDEKEFQCRLSSNGIGSKRTPRKISDPSPTGISPLKTKLKLDCTPLKTKQPVTTTTSANNTATTSGHKNTTTSGRGIPSTYPGNDLATELFRDGSNSNSNNIRNTIAASGVGLASSSTATGKLGIESSDVQQYNPASTKSFILSPAPSNSPVYNNTVGLDNIPLSGVDDMSPPTVGGHESSSNGTAFHLSRTNSTSEKKKQRGNEDSTVTEKRPATTTKGNDTIATKLDSTPPENQPPIEDSGTDVDSETTDIVTITTRKSHTARAGEQPTSKDRTCSGDVIAPSSASNTVFEHKGEWSTKKDEVSSTTTTTATATSTASSTTSSCPIRDCSAFPESSSLNNNAVPDTAVAGKSRAACSTITDDVRTPSRGKQNNNKPKPIDESIVKDNNTHTCTGQVENEGIPNTACYQMGNDSRSATMLMDRTNPRSITNNAFGNSRFSSSLTANVERDLKKKTSSLHELPEPSITEASSVKGLSSSPSSAALRILVTTNTAGGSEHSTRLELYTTPNTTTENNNDKNDNNNSNNNKHTTTTTNNNNNNNNDERQLDATEPNRKTPSLPAVTHTIVSSDETNEDGDNNNNNDNNRESSAVSVPNGSKSIMEKDRESRNALGLSPQENEVSEEPIDDSSKQKIEFRQHRTILAANSHAPSLRFDMDIDNKSGAKDSVRNAAANNNESLNDGSSSQLQTNNNTSVVDALPRKENGGNIDTSTVHNNEAASKSPVVNRIEQTQGIGLGALQINGEENNTCKPPATKLSGRAHRGLRDKTNNDEILSSAGSEKHSSENILATTADSISSKSSVSKKTNAIETKETEGEQKEGDDASMYMHNEDNEGSTSSTGSNKGNDSEIDNEEEDMGSFHNNKTDTPPSVANRSQFSPIDTMEEPEEFSWTMTAAVTTTAVGEETAAAAPLSVAETGNEEAPPPAAVDPSITMTTRTTIKTTEKEEEAKGSRNADPPRVEQERATAQQEQPSAVLPEAEKEEGSAPSSSQPQPQPQPQPQQQQGKLVGEAADLAATTAPAAAVTGTTTTALSVAATTMATIVPPVVTVRLSVGTIQGNTNNNTTNPPPSSATNLQAPSTTAVDPTIADVTAVLATAIDSPVTENSLMNPFVGTNEDNDNNTTNPPSLGATNLQASSIATVDPTIPPPVHTVRSPVGTNQDNNNNTTNPPSSSAMSDIGSSGCNSNGENTNEKIHAGSNLESFETEEEEHQEQDDAVEEEKEDDDARGNNSEIDDAGDCGQGERGSSPAASSNNDNEMTSDYSGDLLGDDGDTDNSGNFSDDDDDDDNHDSKRTTENSGDSLGEDGDDNNRTESKAKPIGSRPIAASANTDDPDGHDPIFREVFTAAAPDSTVPNQNPSPSLTDRLAASTGSVVTTELLLNVTNSDNNNNGDNDDRSRVQDLLVSIMNILYMKKFSGATNIIGYLTNIRSADHLRGDNTEFKSIAAAFGALTVTGEARERVFNPDNAPMNTIVSFFVDNKITSVNGIIRTMIHIFKNTFNQKNKSVYEMLATITTVRIITDLELINDPESDEFDDGFFDYVLYLPTSNDSKMRFFPWKYPLINDHYYFIEAVLMRLPNGKLKICHAEGDHIQQHKFSIDDGNNSIVAAEWEVFRVHCEKNNFMIELIKMKKAPLYIQNNVVGARPVRPSQHPNVKIIGDDDFESEETEISCGPDGVGLAIMHMTGANITYSWVRQQMIACSSNGYRNIMDMTSILNAYGLEVRGSKRRVDNNIDVFKYSTGVYLFVFEFHDEADNSASTKKNRHTAVYIADERLIMDNCGPATRLYPAEDIIDNDSIQVVMREKWGEHLTYNIIKICQIIKKGTAPNPAFIETFIEGPKIIKLAEGGKKGLDADNNSNKNKILCRLSLANSVREEVLLTVNPIDEGFVGGRNGNVLFTGREGNASQVLDGRYQKKYDNQSFSKKRDFLSIMLRRKDNNKSLFTSVFLCPFSGECFSSGNLLSVNDADIIHDTSSLNWYSTKKLAVLAAAARAEDNFFSRSSRQGDGKFNSINRTNTKQFCKEPTYSEESDVLLSLDRFKSIDNTAAEMINKLKHLIKARRN